jgi:phosphatidylserine decarboxylase
MNSFKRSEPSSQVAFPIARAGYPLIFGAAFVTAILALLGFAIPALIGLAGTLFICFFFRDPDRLIPEHSDIVVSPADGKVIFADTADGGRFFEGSCQKISIFMSVFNVHVNRIPHEGNIRKVVYHPGKFFSAHLDKASTDNEHNALFLETSGGKEISVVQIAGLIARRIICIVQEGDVVDRGQRFGLICFGSRLDVYLPPEAKLSVKAGDKVRAGTSVLAHLT